MAPHCRESLYGAFVWARRALNSRKWRFPARAVGVLRLLLARGVELDAVDPRNGTTAGVDESLLSFRLPPFSLLWRVPMRGAHRGAE